MTTAEYRTIVVAFHPGAGVHRVATGWAVVCGVETLSSVYPSCASVDLLWMSAYNAVLRRTLKSLLSEKKEARGAAKQSS